MRIALLFQAVILASESLFNSINISLLGSCKGIIAVIFVPQRIYRSIFRESKIAAYDFSYFSVREHNADIILISDCSPSSMQAPYQSERI